MSEIHAAIGTVQIKKLPGFLVKRKENFKILDNNLKAINGIRVLPQPSNGHLDSCCYCLGALFENNLASKRPEILNALSKKGIGASVYYPQPVPRMKYYQDKYGYDQNQYPIAAQFSDGIIALPVGPHLDSDDMVIIANELKQCIEKIK